jgi:DNA-binding MarR family transcriptional regulator
MPRRAPLELERFLPYRLNVAAESVSRALSRIYGERHGIGIPEWRVIATLGQYRRMTAKAIGHHSRMHKTKVSRAIAELERLALIARAANKADKREEFLTLTARGQRIYRELVPAALGFERALTEQLGRRDAKVLDQLLAKLERRALQLGADQFSRRERPDSAG